MNTEFRLASQDLLTLWLKNRQPDCGGPKGWLAQSRFDRSHRRQPEDLPLGWGVYFREEFITFLKAYSPEAIILMRVGDSNEVTSRDIGMIGILLHFSRHVIVNLDDYSKEAGGMSTSFLHYDNESRPGFSNLITLSGLTGFGDDAEQKVRQHILSLAPTSPSDSDRK